MFRAHRATTWVDVAWRLVAPLLVLSLALSLGAATADPVKAGASGGDVATLRQAQHKAEAAMRRADRQIARLQQQRRHHAVRFAAAKRALDKAIGKRAKVQHKVAKAERRLARKQAILGRAVRVHPHPRGVQAVDKPALRKNVRKLRAKVARLHKQERKLSRAVDRARDLKQARAKKVGAARVKARKAERERAEDKLSVSISRMLDLSKARASSGFSTSSKRTFSKPVKGTTSQPYGCTGYAANPRRGSCAHFHDGVDLAAPKGTKVRASADGYVAYVGFNPWDAGSRSFVVIIGHARGYETIYAHLKAARPVRAGQRVERGQVIGFVGMTGHTSGPHVHWEVSRGFRTVDPLKAGR